MVSVASTSSTSSTSSSSTTSSLGEAAGLGKDDFMQLLIAQLKNQDPMKPMEDKEFITQLAQFSSLEATEKLNTQLDELLGSQSLVQAATLIGKQATAKLESGETVTGVISEVRMISGQPTAIINGQEVDTSLITVLTGSSTTTTSAATTTGAATRAAATTTTTTPTVTAR
ncbi:MAG: flagellar biosynthesis protein FlgD [Chloroflexi bacterium]|nr:flagellar biosynthesis protein FlgD [Chloroflexota bacterium]